MDYAKAVRCATMSQEIYTDFAKLRFSNFSDIAPHFIDRPTTDTQCALLPVASENRLYVVFRGSDKKLDWQLNLDMKQEVVEFRQEVIQDKIVEQREQIYPYSGESSSGAKMHRGFITAYMSVRDEIHDYIKNQTAPAVTITGHSLGGALAALCAVDLQYNFADKVAIEVFTFGAPKAGNKGFRDSYNRRVPESYRFVHGMDIVAALPRSWQGYRHTDREDRLGKRFSLRFLSQRFEDHKITNYISNLKALAAKQG